MIDRGPLVSSCSLARNGGAAGGSAFGVQGTQPGEAAFCRLGFAVPDPQGGPASPNKPYPRAVYRGCGRLSRMFEGNTPPRVAPEITVYRGWKTRLSRMVVYAEATPGSPENKGFQHHCHFLPGFTGLAGRFRRACLSRMKSRLSRMVEEVVHRLPSIADVSSSFADVLDRLSRMPISVYRGCKSAAKPRVSGLPGSLTRVRG